MELTILMPCLNEEETLLTCLEKAKGFIDLHSIDAEMLVADNGSTDQSIRIAKEAGARVVHIEEKGYGAALIGGIEAAKGTYVIMGDADDSYDFSQLSGYMQELRNGSDLVMGNRFKGGIKKGAMPFLHRYLGNPVLSLIGRVFFNIPVRDFHCGLRAFNRERILALGLVTTGMEFASEMVVKASIEHLRITEVPTILSPDGRTRAPHLRTWQDGWRHLVFLLIYSPRWLFFIPSLLFLFVSVAGLIVLLPDALQLKSFSLDIHTLTISGVFSILSYQLFLFALFIRIYSINQGLFPARKKHQRFTSWFSLEKGLIIGILLSILGLVLFVDLFTDWASLNYGPIENLNTSFRKLIPSLTLMVVGFQTIFSSFFIRILNIKAK